MNRRRGAPARRSGSPPAPAPRRAAAARGPAPLISRISLRRIASASSARLRTASTKAPSPPITQSSKYWSSSVMPRDGRTRIGRPLTVMPRATARSRASVTGGPTLFGPSPEMSMMRLAGANARSSNSADPEVERPRDRGAARGRRRQPRHLAGEARRPPPARRSAATGSACPRASARPIRSS